MRAATTSPPACKANAVLPLNQADGSPESILAPVLGAPLSLCSAAPSANVRAKLNALKPLYRTNRALAHKRLLALVAAIAGRRVQLADRRLAATGCDGLDQKISTSPSKIAGLGDELAAAKLAQAVGDASADSDALAAAGATFKAWGDNGSGAATVADWFAIAQGAFALGDEAYAQQALANAHAAGIDLEEQLLPSETGGHGDDSDEQLSCLGQLDNVLALFNPTLACSNMPSGSEASGVAGRTEVGPQDAAGISNTGVDESGGTLSPDLDCAYVDTEITQVQDEPFAGVEIQLDYEQPQEAFEYAVANYGFGAWEPVGGLGTSAYVYETTSDDGLSLTSLLVWDHFTEITVSGYGPLGGYETLANEILKALGPA